MYENQVFNSVPTIIIAIILSLIVGGIILIFVTHISRKRFRYFYSQLTSLRNSIEELLIGIDNIKCLKSIDHRKNDEFKNQYLNSVNDIDALRDEIDTMQIDLRKKIEIVHKQAFVDRLTSLKNMAAYMQAINTIDAHIHEENPFSVAVFDICGLKNIAESLPCCSNRLLLSCRCVYRRKRPSLLLI